MPEAEDVVVVVGEVVAGAGRPASAGVGVAADIILLLVLCLDGPSYALLFVRSTIVLNEVYHGAPFLPLDQMCQRPRQVFLHQLQLKFNQVASLFGI